MCTFKKPSYHQRECFINEFSNQTLKQIGKRLQTCLEHLFCWKIFRNYNDMISKTFYIYEKCSFFHKVILFILLFSPVFIIPNIWGGRHKNAIFWQHKSLYPQKWKNVVTDKLWHMNGDYEIFEIDTLWFGGHMRPFQILPTKWITLNMWQKNVICLCFFYLILKLKSLINDGR